MEVLVERVSARAQTSLFLLNNSLNHVHSVHGFGHTRRRGEFLRADASRVPEVLLSYATSYGQDALAYSASVQKPSPYVAHLASNLQQPGVELRDALRRTRRAVAAETKGFQNPMVDDRLTRELYLADRPRGTRHLWGGSLLAVAGLAMVGTGAYWLAASCPCAASGGTSRAAADNLIKGSAFLGIGLPLALGGTVVATWGARVETRELTLALQGPGVALGLRF